MKIIVIAVSIVLMLTGGGVSVMKALQWGPFAPGTDMDIQTASTNKADTSSDEPPVYIDMDPLVVPVFAGDKVAATLQFDLKLETLGDANKTKITKLLPRISDAFIKDLHAFLPRHIRKEGQLSVGKVKRRLELVGQKVTGKGVLKGVLVQSVNEN